MKDTIFREYDIRGIIDQGFCIEDSKIIAKGILTYFLQQNPNTKSVAIGMDGRTHSPQIKNLVIETITNMGINVIDIGLCPTPVFYFSLFNNKEIQSGFIITASHNPKEYNGFKICLDQKSVWGTQIQEIKEICKTQNFYQNTSNTKGSIKQFDVIDAYINWLENHFAHLKNLQTAAVVDCGNGTAGVVLEKLVEKMNWPNIKLLFAEVDGTFPNHEADPTVIKNMQAVIKAFKENEQLEFGIGFDGDCDRMAPITKSGYLVPGDKLLAIYSKQVIEDQPNATVVFDIKSSLGLLEELEKLNAKAVFSPSGHSLIKDSMIKNNALLAGELSCHFFFKHRYFGYDDGIYAMMRLFEILHQSQKKLETLLSSLPIKISSPEYRIACKESEKQKIVEDVKNYFLKHSDAKTITIDGIRAQLDYGWGLARVSNTQPVISLRFEGESKEGLKKIKNEFANALIPHFEGEIIKKELEL